MLKLPHHCTHLTRSKEMLKILQVRLQQYVNCELPDVQAGFRKGRGTKDQIANIRWIIEKAREFQKKYTSALLTMPKPLTVWITTNCGKFFQRWEYQITWPASSEICMQVRKQQLEQDMEQQTGSERLLLNHNRRLGFLAPGGEYNMGPEMRLDHSELLCNKVLLKCKGDRESFWHRHQKHSLR